MNLLNKTPEEFFSMSTEEINAGYKIIISHLLFTFYIDSMNASEKINNVEELRKFIDDWILDNFKDAHSDWNPGDTGK